MKSFSFVLCAAVLMAACNTQPMTLSAETKDSAALQEQALPAQDSVEHPQQSAPAKEQTTTTKKHSASSSHESNASGSMSSESESSAKAKKGWSKTAKGAVIGGAVGAGTGAVVNKKNRAKGAVVGGLIGAGTGAVIGNEMDKKDGRH